MFVECVSPVWTRTSADRTRRMTCRVTLSIFKINVSSKTTLSRIIVRQIKEMIQANVPLSNFFNLGEIQKWGRANLANKKNITEKTCDELN